MRLSGSSEKSFQRMSSWSVSEDSEVKTRNLMFALSIALLTGALVAPAVAVAQESKCNPCEAEDRERVVRRYQQEIGRARREIETLERQLASTESALDTATV